MGLSFFPALLCRCPAKPFEDASITPDITILMNDLAFMEAIHLASPVLYGQCQKYMAGGMDLSRKQKLVNSLTKYYNRMRSRPTPFGLFSGCAILQWGAATHITIDTTKWQRHIRFDVDFLCSLIQQLQQHTLIRHHLLYRFNTSLYKVGNEYRYYEYQLEDHLRKYQVSAVPASPLLNNLVELCSRTALPFRELCDQIVAQEEVSAAEAEQYMEALIHSQLLVSNLSFQVTGADFLERIIQILQPIHAATKDAITANYVTQLLQMQQQLRCSPAAPCLPGALQEISDNIAKAGIPFQPNRLFQVDCTVACRQQTVDQQLQTSLIAALEALQVLCAGNTDSQWLTRLKEKFVSKYDTAPVPLTHIVDPDTGIIADREASSIELDGQPLEGFLSGNPAAEAPSAATPSRDAVQTLLTEKLLQAFREDAYTITFTDTEINALRKKVSLRPLPDTFSVMFSYVNNNTILLESAGGASGSALIGRFGHTNETIRALLQSIHAFEQSKHPAGMLTSVVHLPEDRTGNILQHPAVRCFEIPYLANSSLPPERQLSVSDLHISLQQGELTLFSLQHEKNVLPRIDNAHNYVFNTLPLYRLLGELQGQGKQTGLTFSWHMELPGISFFPRVQYKEVILCPAQWHLPIEHYKDLLLPDGAAAFYLFAGKWKLPRFFVLANGDQGLLVDQEDIASIQAFVAAIKEQPQIILKEFLYASGPATVKDEYNRPYTHQIIAVVRNDANAMDHAPQRPAALTDRQFAIGSEWLYFKLYCNTHYANELLLHTLAATCQSFTDQGLIDRWFFVRYQDPDDHLRIRFHLTGVTHTSTIIDSLQRALQPALQDQFVWKVQTDTYYREMERYGAACMQEIEQLFFLDSRYVLHLLQQHAMNQHAPTLLLSALQYMDDLLQLFSFTLPQKLAFTAHYQEAFDREFNTCKEEKEMYNQYFRNNTQQINELFRQDALKNNFPEWQLLIQERNRQFAAILPAILQKQRTATTLPGMAGDLLHMHFNRLFHTAQRRYEMIIYNMMCKYYRSLSARKGPA